MTADKAQDPGQANMRYQETTAVSAELLRMILPRVARHGGSYSPTTYAVWYQYLGGLNAELNADLDARLKRSETLAQSDYEQMYAKYIDVRETQMLEKFQGGLGELLRRLGEIAGTTGTGAAEFAQVLTECENKLSSIGDAEELGHVIRSLVASTAAVRDSTEALSHEVAATRDEIQQLRGQLGVLQNQAQTDALTRLLNRRGFEQAVNEFRQDRAGALDGCAILLVDIDHFKRVNDTFGHLYGDQVINAAARVLQGGVKGRDIVARWGGEEFVVLLPDTHGEGAIALAEQIRSAFSKVRVSRGPKQEAGQQITISIGVAVIAPREALEQAIGRADVALYRAKDSGRNCVRVAGIGDIARPEAEAEPEVRAASA
jgi:diguanylate cyclase